MLTWLPTAVHGASPPFLDGAPRLSTLLPRESVASVDGAFATVANPAALDANPSPDFAYVRTVKGDFAKDDGLFLSLYGSGIGLEFGHDIIGGKRVSFRKTTLSGGSHLGGGIYWGALRSGFSGKAGELHDDLVIWDVGALFRRRWSSLGVVARNVNRPMLDGSRLERAFDFGYAVRPGTNRLTLSFDLRKPDDESFRTAWNRRRYFASATLEPVDGIRLTGTAFGDRQFEARVAFDYNTFGIGSHSRLDGGEHVAQAGILRLHRARAANVVSRPRYAVVTTPDQWQTAYWRIRRDPRVSAVIVKLDGERMPLAGWQEFRAQLNELRAKGVSTAAYIRHTGTGGYWLATVADTILLDPIGEIELVGLYADTLYYKNAMERFGVDAQLERIGEYKSGTEPFTRDEPSDAVLANMNELLDDLYDQVTRGIADARGVEVESVRRLIDEGPYLGNRAVSARLVDGLATPDEAEKTLRARFAGAQWVTAPDYSVISEAPRDWSQPPPGIAIVRVEGVMIDGETIYNPLTGSRFVGADTVSSAIRDAGSDGDIRAIVLDIESGGGLVTASETMWRAVKDAREHKPVVARIRGMGGSGAYYLASGTDRIIAEPASVTGSIGVFSGRMSVHRLLSRIGVDQHALKRGANSDLYSEYAPLTDAGRDVLKEQVGTLYEQFLDRVAAGREMTRDEVHEVAQGRVWTGKQAVERGLIDELGGMSEAIASAKELAGIRADRLMTVKSLPKPTWLERLDMGGLLGLRRSSASPLDGIASLAWNRTIRSLTRPRAYAWLPWTVSD